jgi:ubiquitin-protein ligase E3 A
LLDTRLNWFSRGDTPDDETVKEYNLIGRLIGLAIYNGVILDINYPLAIYKKCLGHNCEFSDLIQIDEQLARGLEQLLEFDGDVEEVFQRTFQVEFTSSSGENTSYDLKPDGASIPVTKSNRAGTNLTFYMLRIRRALRRLLLQHFRLQEIRRFLCRIRPRNGRLCALTLPA